jgi:hypothetical protein
VIAYLDASALVKRYLVERGSRETVALTSQAEMIATSIISRAEVAAGLAKAGRVGVDTCSHTSFHEPRDARSGRRRDSVRFKGPRLFPSPTSAVEICPADPE